MTDAQDPVTSALDQLRVAVAASLTASGWNSVDLRDLALRTFTRATRGGVMATAEMFRMSFSTPPEFPVTIRVTTGVGYRPALDLMPLLTLPAEADLIPMRENDDRPTLMVTVSDDHDVARATAEIVAMIEERALTFAERFADTDAIDRHLQELEQSSTGTDSFYASLLRKTRLVLVTSAGRHDAARTLLATFEPSDHGDRRFQRQLTRWLDAGRTVIPPVEETLALLPREPVVSRPSVTEVRAQAALKKEASDSVRAQARGKSVDELTALLATAYAQRDIEVSTATLRSSAVAMELQHQPFGRARATLRGLKMLASVGVDTVGRFRSGFTEDPAWLQPPERASFPIDVRRGRKATVTLDPEAAAFIARVLAEAPARYGFLTRVDVWFQPGSDREAGPDREAVPNGEPRLDAYIGEHRVGTLEPADAATFGAVLRAAALFDEAPFVRGQIIDIEGTPVALQVPLPADASPSASQRLAVQHGS